MQKEQDNRNNNSWSVVKGNKKRNGRRSNKTPRDWKPESSRSTSTEYRSSRWDTIQNEQKKNVPEQKTLIPTKPTINYAIITSSFTENKNTIEEYTHTNNTEYCPSSTILIPSLRTKPSVRGTKPKPNHNVSYGVWEYKYFKYIIDLSDIFLKGAKRLGINTDMNDTEYMDFLYVFGQFIRDCSSGEMSPFVEDPSAELNNFYIHYTILRNEN